MWSCGIKILLTAALLMGAAPAKQEVGQSASNQDKAAQAKPAASAPKSKKVAQKTKKDDKKSTKIHPKKTAAKSIKKKSKETLSPEDAEIIKHLEFLMMLGLLEDFDLFEQEAKPK
jgi:hypothetical protein